METYEYQNLKSTVYIAVAVGLGIGFILGSLWFDRKLNRTLERMFANGKEKEVKQVPQRLDGRNREHFKKDGEDGENAG